MYHTNSRPIHQKPHANWLERHKGKKEEAATETTDVHEVERDWLPSWDPSACPSSMGYNIPRESTRVHQPCAKPLAWWMQCLRVLSHLMGRTPLPSWRCRAKGSHKGTKPSSSQSFAIGPSCVNLEVYNLVISIICMIFIYNHVASFCTNVTPQIKWFIKTAESDAFAYRMKEARLN